MDLLSYFRALRRRWWVILVCDGASAPRSVWLPRAVKTSDGTGKARTYYKATDTLSSPELRGQRHLPVGVHATSTRSPCSPRRAPCPMRWPPSSGPETSGPQLAERITTLTNGTSSTLGITAVAATPTRRCSSPTPSPSELLANIAATDQERYNQAQKDATDRLDAIQAKIDALLAQVRPQPPAPTPTFSRRSCGR